MFEHGPVLVGFMLGSTGPRNDKHPDDNGRNSYLSIGLQSFLGIYR